MNTLQKGFTLIELMI
ncbi:prepilin-type N-terminal cleavage/methylation domain-containing protein, partial [Neisseria meningitidis]